MKRLLAGVIVLVMALSAAAGGDVAQAHALLVRADPPVNAQLREPPRVLTLYFSEPLERRFSGARVIDQDGNQVEERIEFDDADNALMRVYLEPLQPGYITINWETVSTVDGHRVSGSYPLTILNPDGSLPAGEPGVAGASIAGEEPTVQRVLTRWVLLLAASIFAGALAFLVFVTPGIAREGRGEEARSLFERRALLTAAAALTVLVVAGLVELVLQSMDIGSGLGGAFDTRWGERWLLRNLILIQPAVLLLLMQGNAFSSRLLAGMALVAAAAYLAVTASVSHAAAGGGAFWATTVDFVHLTASSVWIGMLGLLVLLFTWAHRQLSAADRHPILAVSLKRFSLVALVSVALLVATGTFNAIVQVGSFSDLLETGYGRALLIKLILVVPLLGIGFFNAFLLRADFSEAVETRRTRDQRGLLTELEARLQRQVRWELGIAVVVLLVVAVLVQLTPTRGRLADPSQTAGEYIATQMQDGLQATLVVTPNQPGNNTFEVYLAGAVDTVESLRLEFVQPGGFVGDASLPLEASNPPTFYLGQGPFITDDGNWIIVLNVRRVAPAVTDLRLSFDLRVKQPGETVSEPRTGGALDAPFPLSAGTLLVLFGGVALSVAMLLGAVPRPGLPEGYLGWLAAELSYRFGGLNVRPAWSLAVLIVAGIGLGMLLGSHVDSPVSEEEARRNNPVPATQQSVETGRMLFVQNCAICHGETGRGDGPVASTLPIPPANLYDHIPYHPDQFFFGVITKGLSGIMPAFENQLSEEERWHILNYLRAQFTAEPAAQ
jgi:copper transport protein